MLGLTLDYWWQMVVGIKYECYSYFSGRSVFFRCNLGLFRQNKEGVT